MTKPTTPTAQTEEILGLRAQYWTRTAVKFYNYRQNIWRDKRFKLLPQL